MFLVTSGILGWQKNKMWVTKKAKVKGVDDFVGERQSDNVSIF